jgi:hypothetical protein
MGSSKLLYDWRSVSQSTCLGIEHPCGTCDQILLPVGMLLEVEVKLLYDWRSVSQYVLVSSTLVEMLLSEICRLVSVGRPFRWEDGSTICSVITQWSESLRTRNHTLLSHLRFPQPGGPGSRIYIPVSGGYTRALGSLYVVSYDSPLTTCRATVEVSNLPPTWRARSPYIYPSESGWSSPKPKVKVTLWPTVSRSVCLGL